MVSLRKIAAGGGGGGGGAVYNPVTEITVVADGPVLLAPGLLAWIEVLNPLGLAAFSLGTTDNGGELLPPTAIAANEAPISIGMKFNIATNVYVNGITSETTIRFYKF